MNIIVSANSKYMRYLYVMLTSLFENNREADIFIYIMQRDFTNYDKKCITELTYSFQNEVFFLFVDEKRLAGLPVTDKFSLETYFRLIMGDILPESIDKILYLDVDIIIRDDISDFYNIDITDHIAGVCLDTDHPVLDPVKRKLFDRKEDLRYFNAGVMLWNIKRLRKEYSLESFLSAAKKLGYSLQFADQEILNFLLYNKVLYLDSDVYNWIVRGDMNEEDIPSGKGVILHYAGCNPWQAGQKNQIYKIWWSYAKRTPFYLNLAEEQLWKEFGFGSEKEANIVRDAQMRDIYERAFQLKGTGRIRKYLKDNNFRYGVYGAGVMAEVFYDLMENDDSWNYVEYVVDRYRTGRFHDIIIQNSIDDVATVTWIVTPAYKTLDVVKGVQSEINSNSDSRVISLLDWLKCIE